MTPRAVAARYARALFDVVIKKGDPAEADRELTAVAELLAGHEELARVAANPALPASRKRAIVQALVDRLELSAEVGRLLLLLAERDRLTILPDVAAAHRARVLDHLGIVRGEITTAAPIDGKRRAALEASLARATGRTVQLTNRVDPEIIAGAVTRLGSVVYDGSVARQLERLRARLLEA